MSKKERERRFKNHLQCKRTSNGSEETSVDKKNPKKTKINKFWTEEETIELIEQLESRPCLWDVYHTTYSKRDVKELAYAELSDQFELPIAEIKSKVKRLNFFRSVLASSKRFDSIHANQNEIGDKVIEENESRLNRVCKRKTLSERKLDLLSKCTDAITSGSANNKTLEQTVSHFASYIDEKLKKFDNRTRAIAEKRISNVIFDLEFRSVETSCASAEDKGSASGLLKCRKNFLKFVVHDCVGNCKRVYQELDFVVGMVSSYMFLMEMRHPLEIHMVVKYHCCTSDLLMVNECDHLQFLLRIETYPKHHYHLLYR